MSLSKVYNFVMDRKEVGIFHTKDTKERKKEKIICQFYHYVDKRFRMSHTVPNTEIENVLENLLGIRIRCSFSAIFKTEIFNTERKKI